MYNNLYMSKILKPGDNYIINNIVKQFSSDFVCKDIIEYNPSLLNKLYTIIKDICEILDYYDIEYFIIGGTLLGAIRHQGLIPWDNDIDFAITINGYDKLKKLKNEINWRYYKKYIFIDSNFPGFRVSTYADGVTYVDLFVIDILNKSESDKNNLYAFSAPYFNNKPTFGTHYLFPKIKFNHDIVFPIQNCNFEDFSVKIPNKPFEFLKLNYDESCLTTIKLGIDNKGFNLHSFIHDDHINNEFFAIFVSYIFNDDKPIRYCSAYWELTLILASKVYVKAFSYLSDNIPVLNTYKISIIRLVYQFPIFILLILCGIIKTTIFKILYRIEYLDLII